MSKSITQMLRDYARDYTTTPYHDALIRKAATEIEFHEERWDQLRQQLDALRDHQVAYETETEQQLASRDADVNLLRDAIAQLLDDMGEEGHCVCEAAKQQALAALTITEPK